MALTEEHREQVGGLGIFWRSRACAAAPVLYLHGVPTNADDWTPFLERTGGIAPDLPGFGRSDKPADFAYSIPGYARFLEAFVDHLGAERLRLVVHDWGAVGLALAQRRPELIERLVVINAVPLLPGYRWHRIARVWRTRGLGELAMGATTKWGLRLISREARVGPGPMPDAFIEDTWAHFDHGTQRAILRLYRSAPPATLAAAGADLRRIAAPALVLWGERDPYLPPAFGDAYGAALPGATVERVPDAGHWPWIDRPDLVDRVARFLDA